MKTIRKLKWTLVMVCCIWAGVMNAQTWTPLSGNQSSITIAAGTTQYYRLTGDVAMNGAFTVHGTLYLDLNGYVLKRSDHKNALFSVQPTGTLTISDSRPDVPHYGIPKTISVYDDSFDYLWDYDASYTASTPGAIEIKGGIITGGIGQTGGAIYSYGTINLTGGSIAGNFIYCGPFKVDEEGVWVEKIKHPWKFEGQHPDYNFNDVASAAYGSGCYVDRDENGVPTGYNNIKGEGGGIWLSCNATLNMSGGRICYNYAAFHGGGVYCAGKFNMTGGLIDHNYTMGGYGGGVFINHCLEAHPNFENGLVPVGEMVMNGGEMSNNTSWGGSGGAIMAWKDSFLTIENGSFYYNQALGQKHPEGLGNGGAIYGERATLVIKNVDIQHNFSHRYGGGIYIWLGSDLKMDEGTCIINGNKATSGGGVAVAYPTCTATLGSGVEIKNDTALLDGGGIFMQGGVLNNNGATIEDCIAGNNGGGVALWVRLYKGNITYNMTSGIVQNNHAGTSNDEYDVTTVPVDYYRSGGGISITADYALSEGQAENVVEVNLDGGTIKNNTVVGDYGKHGGGLFVSINTENSSATVNVNTGASFENNEANEYGGGFYLNSGTINVNGGHVNGNTAGINGGGVFIGGTTSSITVSNNAQINDNIATQDGGGFYAEGGSVLIQTNSHVDGNTATTGRGGGVFSISGVTVDNSSVSDNTAVTGGGFYIASTSGTVQTIVRNATAVNNNNANNGAGAYVESGTLTIVDNGTQVNGNTATNSGGGIYMANGTVTFTDAKMQTNTATNNDGGGLYLGNGTMTVSGANAAFTANKAKNRGGGVYVGGGSFTMTGGAIGGTTAQGNYTTSGAGYGGGLYMGGGTATLSGGTLGGNKAAGGYGGGIYMNGGTCTLSNGATIGGASSSYANSAKFGGGIYSQGGTITVKGGKLQYNTASTAGGGIYTNGASGVVNMEKQTSKADLLSYIEHNTAQEGGGIYANRGVVNFSDGYIQYNRASEAGGGIYVNRSGDGDYGTLNLKGSANLSYNSVPEGHDGGGVYLKGQIVVGEQTANLGRIMAQTNYSGDSYSYTWEDHGNPTDSIDHILTNNRNNVYLPLPEVRDDHTDVIEIIENGIRDDSHVGFSVEHGYVPVIYCRYSETSRDYLHQFSTGQAHQYNVFDDTRRYVAVQYSNQPDVFDPDHVYLYGFWSNEVTGDPTQDYCEVNTAIFDNNPIPISTPCELAYFISWVNGLNGVEAHPNANAILTADIDMREFGWVPIGKSDAGYGGTFDGNGHTVSGLVGLLYREYTDYGFFGKLKAGATVKDLFVNGASFYLEENGSPLVVGGLAGEINNNVTISNSEVASNIYVENTGSVVGGLIGRMNAGTVHSTIGISDMKGYLMGGLVGELLGGSLYNSFSNCKYTKAESHDKYMGGLVAVNRGTVENCYARLRGSAPTGNFGILVGDNTDGTVNYCYAPAGMTNYKVAGANPTGHGNYGESFLPYLYGHRDTQVSLANSSNGYVPTDANADKQMMNVLNNWVDAKSTASVAYTTWGRPWQESNTLKPLNDDYPILRMPMAEAVGAKAGDPYLYYNPVDSLLVRYTDAESAIWLYRNPADVVRGDNSGSSAKLYIAEDVALKNLNELKAYVGITLDNSAGANGGGANPTYGSFVGIETDETDWHMISTSLSDAPIGINYSDNGSYDFSWGHPEGMPYYLFYPKGNLRNGYFPSHRFGESYPSTDARIEAGSYYNEWDFYAYSEPNYHWINFKRNSTSHHHFDTEGHEAIEYHNGDPLLADDLGNESRLVPGKGYFAATREETFLQCQGHLNADEVTIGLTHTPNIPRHGYNLIGNPFQAYLDFDAFADANWGDDVDVIWSEGETPSYTILDEDYLETDTNVETLFGDKPVFYKTFSYGCSSNPDVSAGGFIHPHQGFFVRLGDDKTSATAYFEPDQRNVTAKSKFRGNDHIDYPLVNLFAIEENGAADVVTVELGRPDQGGAALMQSLRVGNGKIWCHYNDKDYAIAYTQPGISEVAIRFETVADTEYTMRWSTRNGDFSYLHLIDNQTGADVDCLTTDEYKFSASTSDYKSRFRLVFGYTGIEEPEEVETSQNFAFVMGDELVVTGEGVLQVFDVNGRLVAHQELHGIQTTMALPNVANGVYVMRLTEGKQSRIQKMVISK